MPLQDIIEYGLLVLSFAAGSLALNRIIQIACSHYFYGTTPQQEIAYTLQWWGLGHFLPQRFSRSIERAQPGDRIIGIDLRFLSIAKRGGIWFWRLGRVGGSFYISKGE